MSDAQAAPTPTSATTETPVSQNETPAADVSSSERLEATTEGETGSPVEAKSTEDDYLSDEEWTKLSKKKRKLKFGDEDAEMTLEEIAKNTALNKTVTKRGQEAADLRRQSEQNEARLQQFFEKAKEDPTIFWELMEKLGHDPEAVAIQRARQAYEWSQMTEQQREFELTKRENARMKAEREAEKAAKDAEQRDSQLQAVEQEVQSDIINIVKELDISPDVVTMERIAQASTFLYNRDNKKPQAKEVAQFVLQHLEQDVARYIKKLSPEKASELFGKEFIDKFQASLIKQAEKNLPGSPSKRTSADDSDRTRRQVKKEIGIDDWMKTL
jgi:hypothetical protein